MSCMFGVIVQVVCRTSTGGAAGTGNIWIVGCNGAGIDTIAVKGGGGLCTKCLQEDQGVGQGL